jgi:hypothetical protein
VICIIVLPPFDVGVHDDGQKVQTTGLMYDCIRSAYFAQKHGVSLLKLPFVSEGWCIRVGAAAAATITQAGQRRISPIILITLPPPALP